MSIETSCQVPGVFHIEIGDRYVSIDVDLDKSLKLTKKEAKILEANLHNAIELVLARYQ